ncbi:MAG: c-type cytochrome [Sandaracinaceae bacterium]
MILTNRALGLVSSVCLLLACGGEAPAPAVAERPSTAVDDGRGGRLFDDWRHGADEDAAGRTLTFGDGRPLPAEGHDNRLKNLFGWDLRGRAGIYGPDHMNREFVLDANLLATTGSASELADRLERGDAALPAFGSVLDREALESVARFVVGVRDRALPHPDDLFTLTTPEAGHYALLPGGDAERGAALYAERCASCHGADGTGMLFGGGAYSLGSHARQKAYEDWLKILNGQPGSPMSRQVRGPTGPEMTQEILDLFAALCDRSRFPLGPASGPDVEDGDARCGAYLR